jgi:VWFA-related protein
MRLRYPILFCLVALAAPAQNDPSTHESAIRVNTRLVEVDVVVRDKNGPVRGLTKTDFTILDRGKPQTIATFGVRSANRSAPKPAPLPAGTVSNRLNRRGEEAGGATVVLWDMLNTEMQDQAYVRGQVLKYLHTLTEGDPVALYALVKDLKVIQDFTDDPARLIRAVAGVSPEQSFNLSAADLTDLVNQINNPFFGGNLAGLQTAAQNAAGEMTDYNLKDRAWVTANSLAAIAWHLAGLPGRKKLVWISASFPGVTIDQRSRVGATQIETQNFGLQIDASIRKLNEANVAVYPIDPRGLTTTMPGKANVGYSPAPTTPIPPGTGLMDPSIDTMLLFARGTGGKAIYATNDLVTAMHTVMEDDEVTYTIGFYPVDQKQDGEYHALNVKVDKKGFEVRHRDGYYASDEKVANAGNRRESINAVYGNPLDATQIGLKGAAIPVPNRAGVYRLEITMNTNELHLEHVKDRWLASIDFATLFSPSDSTKGTLETIRLSLTEKRLRETLENGYLFSRDIVAGDLHGELRVVVQDRTTGLSGSVRVPIAKP